MIIETYQFLLALSVSA